MQVVHAVGEWLGTTPGFWTSVLVAVASGPLALYSVSASTWTLSVVAIVLPAFILKRDHDRDEVAARRDEAMHAKLDELLRGVPAADEALVRSEEDA